MDRYLIYLYLIGRVLPEQAAEKTEHRTIDREKVKVKDRSVQR
jgi:hypothetical protein